MWPYVLLAVAVVAFHEVRALHSVSDDAGPISNIELLIPLAVPVQPPPARFERVQETQAERGPDAVRVQRDEPYSAIPAYAFTLDTRDAPQFRAAQRPPPRAELLQTHSLYVAQLWPRGEHAQAGEGTSRAELRREGQRACRRLARAHAGAARDVLLYLCSELVDVLAARCDCCEDPRADTRPDTRPDGSPLPALPWIEPATRRKEYPNRGHNTRLFQQYMHLPKVE
ncbi:uncharacterized protein LOC142984255 [Anticarsia gemmatalis]|uniref:uncharacterized protein LOC142984255 n=1 Tax=Anticarsia gemmatalis TaxID=129554 RepID=UPI003F7601DB